ncbi:recombinase family protein [Yoonia vestfoldensis]|uniref:Resolvase n=1 Tax=Yoonia vestfoldensis TaxID=245188 RepID=A0A1Y0EEN4_9RHOB|nr:recombinase family protein [Yoonia vestfoldensis]ARU01821.1 resolvase [Yoonia vestfoldensis]
MTGQIRAAIYARFSTDMQRDASIDDQIRSCREYAARQGLTVVETYSDRAVSGASLMRSGMQKLLQDGRSGLFDVVISEGLDRLSRNQADIAQIYQTLLFADVMIETVAEGAISEMHIGLKGTMNAIFLKDLAVKTHRGLKGRALAGKSAGGLTYGYSAVNKVAANGEPIRGDRTINAEEAAVVRRIFQDYAKGLSPKKIAEALNIAHIPGPQGGNWGTSTIHGNRDRGTGVLNNELYIGRQIWNRLRYVKDPQTGKRISRLNPESDWVITDVPDLRIIDDDLWKQVRQRQGSLKSKGTGVPVWNRRRPRTLFSGLMECGCCGSGFSKIQKDSFGCSAARNKGEAVCTNKRLIKQTELEARVLDALANNLMDPEAVKVFCEAYTAERNRLAATATHNRAGIEKELASTKRDHGKLVDAIIAGVPADQVKDKMIALDDRRKDLEAKLAVADNPPAQVRLHPKMSQTYRERVAALIRGLAESEGMEEAREALRGLIEKVVLVPREEGSGLTIQLHGALASLLMLATGASTHQVARMASGAQNAKSSAVAEFQDYDIIDKLVLVAGVGFEPTTFRL